jgi:hypothetical protein
MDFERDILIGLLHERVKNEVVLFLSMLIEMLLILAYVKRTFSLYFLLGFVTQLAFLELNSRNLCLAIL